MRSIRLPPYLNNNPLWVSMADAIDSTFEVIDDPIHQLSVLRDVDNYYPTVLASKVGVGILNPADRTDATGNLWSDRLMRVQQASTIGWNYWNSSIIGDDNYDQFIKQAVKFYPEKGTPGFADFLSFCMGTSILVSNLWTTDYVTFYTEAVAFATTGFLPVYSGGTWFPTTHVNLELSGIQPSNVTLDNLVSLFYYIAPINLVLNTVTFNYSNDILQLNMSLAGQMTITVL